MPSSDLLPTLVLYMASFACIRGIKESCVRWNGFTTFEYYAKCYYVSKESYTELKSFDDAESMCNRGNATLASLSSQEESEFLVLRLKCYTRFGSSYCNKADRINQYWIGLYRTEGFAEGMTLHERRQGWGWQDGWPVTWTNWSPSAPLINTNNIYMFLNATWSDRKLVSTKLRFICSTGPAFIHTITSSPETRAVNQTVPVTDLGGVSLIDTFEQLSETSHIDSTTDLSRSAVSWYTSEGLNTTAHQPDVLEGPRLLWLLILLIPAAGGMTIILCYRREELE